MRELICIICPKGCRLEIDEEYNMTGNACPRAKEYAKAEITNPTRVITSTVKVNDGAHKRCPVKTDGAIPKPLIFKAMELLNQITLNTPITIGDKVAENILGTGINFVATKNIAQ